MQARLTPSKLVKAQSLVQYFSLQRSIHLTELQSLLGYLSFCAKVVPIGHGFLRRLFDATRGYQSKESLHQHPPPIRMTADMRANLHWWRDFLLAWKGISLIIQEQHRIFLWTDASGTLGRPLPLVGPQLQHPANIWNSAPELRYMLCNNWT